MFFPSLQTLGREISYFKSYLRGKQKQATIYSIQQVYFNRTKLLYSTNVKGLHYQHNTWRVVSYSLSHCYFLSRVNCSLIKMLLLEPCVGWRGLHESMQIFACPPLALCKHAVFNAKTLYGRYEQIQLHSGKSLNVL